MTGRHVQIPGYEGMSDKLTYLLSFTPSVLGAVTLGKEPEEGDTLALQERGFALG